MYYQKALVPRKIYDIVLYFSLVFWGLGFFLVFTPYSTLTKISNNFILPSFLFKGQVFISVLPSEGKDSLHWYSFMTGLGQQSLFQPIKITITVRDTNRNTLLLVSATTQMAWLKHLSFKLLYCTNCPLSTKVFTIMWYKTHSICMVVFTVCLPKTSMLVHSLLEAILFDVK